MRISLRSIMALCWTALMSSSRSLVGGRSKSSSVVAAFSSSSSFGRARAPQSGRKLLRLVGEPEQGVLRRRRMKHRPDTAIQLIENLQKYGYYKNYRDGALFSTADLDQETRITSSAPVLFPLAGKDPLQQPPRLRFAPSPTGSLHVGGARTALYNWLMAKKGQMEHPKSNSGFVLRIEDTDLARSTKESEDSVLADLRWLGLHWDEGPDDMESRYGPYRQSERNEIYSQIANYLLEQGKAYRCFCTPEELEELKLAQEAAGLQPRYDGRWRDAPQTMIEQKLAVNTPYTVRFKVAPGSRVVIEDAVRGTVSWDADATVGDFILLRSNGVPVYNFCVAVDDAMMGITTVIRAEEHLTNTLRQGLILDALGAPRPRYAHCSLILGEDKQKLSKRHGATSCNQFRLDGFLPDAMINYLALLGWNDGTDNEIFTREELIEAFELNRVVKSPSVFDMNKLRWVNAQHMKRLPIEELVPMVEEQFKLEDVLRPMADDDDAASYDTKVRQVAIAATSLAKQMMETTRDAVLNAKQILGYKLPSSFDQVSDEEGAKTMIEHGNFYTLAKRLIEQFESGSFPRPNPNAPLAAFQDAVGEAIEIAAEQGETCTFTADYMTYMKALAKEQGVKGRDLFHPIRLALTGEMSGQDVTKQLSLLTMASRSDSVLDPAKTGMVTLEERMQRLNAFVETIPEQFRTPRGDAKDKKASDAALNGVTASAQESTNNNAQAESSVSSAKVSDPLNTYKGPPITALDIRVGRIVKVWEHPEADKLYCEEIDVGEGEPRQIASGLRPYMNAEDMEGRKVLVLCNLKERKMVGFPSHGMVLCASNKDHTEVKFVSPPIDAKVGERVTVPDFNFAGENGQPYAENAVAKKKIFEDIAPHLVTSKYGVPEFLGRPLMTSAGVCTSPIPEGNVS